MPSETKPAGDMRAYGVAYLGILLLAGLQIAVAYYTDGFFRLAQMLVLALIQTVLMAFFFMRMRQERPGLTLALIPATIFVLLMMNMIWSDSFRLIKMRPFPN